MITKDEITPNARKIIQMPTTSLARYLDFKHLADEVEYDALLLFFFTNFIRLSTHDVTWSVLSHAFLAPVHRLFGDFPKPVLWLVGRTGDGKTFIVQIAMNLFGDFPEGTEERRYAWTSTTNHLTEQGQYFKDALYFIDDFKRANLNTMGLAGAQSLIANYFDGTGKGTLRRDGKPNLPRVIKGFLTVTGEDIPPVDSATLARTSIVRFPIQERDIEAGQLLLARQSEFRQIMPQYVQWALGQDFAELKATAYKAAHNRIFGRIRGAQNDLRIATMAAQSCLGFELFIRFLVHRRIVTDQEAANMRCEFLGLLETRAVSISTLATDEQGCNSFLRILRSLLFSGEITILQRRDIGSVDLFSTQRDHGRPIGFVRDGEPDAVHVIPELAIVAVSRVLKSSDQRLGFSKETIGSQLNAEGHFAFFPDKGNVRRARYGSHNPWVWSIKATSLDIGTFSNAKDSTQDLLRLVEEGV